MKLNAQEIRHALHPGPVRDFLKALADSDAVALRSVGVQLARYSPHDIDRLVRHRTDIVKGFKSLLRDPEFDKAISQATAMPQRIRKRFTAVRDLAQEFV